MDMELITAEALKAAPPVTVSALISTGVAEIDLWIKGLTVLYLVLQIVFVVLKLRRRKADKDEEE